MKTYDKPQIVALAVELENVILEGSAVQPVPDTNPLPQPTPGGYNQGNIDLAPKQKGLIDDL